MAKHCYLIRTIFHGNKIIHSAQILEFVTMVTMATTKNLYMLILMLINKVVMKILVFGKLFRANVISLGIKSYNQLKLLNLVTMATTRIV